MMSMEVSISVPQIGADVPGSLGVQTEFNPQNMTSRFGRAWLRIAVTSGVLSGDKISDK